MTDNKECFVISPIGEKESKTRQRSDKVLEYVIEGAIEEYGYTPVRADEISEPGIITTQIIERIIKSPLVIADLTNHNANVFYELAVRHAARNPVIQLIDSGQEIPFDVANTRTVRFNLSDVETYENAKREIQDQIESIERGNDEMDNPVTVAVDLQLWRDSGDPQQEDMADIVERITQLQTSVQSIERLIMTQNQQFTADEIDDIRNKLEILEKEHGKIGDSMWSGMLEEDKDQFKKVMDLISEIRAKVDDLESDRNQNGLEDFM